MGGPEYGGKSPAARIAECIGGAEKAEYPFGWGGYGAWNGGQWPTSGPCSGGGAYPLTCGWCGIEWLGPGGAELCQDGNGGG
jgi:hypothetical protein